MRDDRETLPHRKLPAAIAGQRDRVIELKAIVDDARRTLDQAVAQLHDAVRERDRAVRHLQQLIAWRQERAAA